MHARLDGGPSDPTDGRNGSHPLPTAAAFCAWLRPQGIAPGMTVVAYDRSGGMYAARLWWMLRWIGHMQVRVLDGGWKAWTGAGLPEAGPYTHLTVPTTREGEIAGGALAIKKEIHVKRE